MKKSLLILFTFCLSALTSSIYYSQYCSGGPSSTADSNTESVDLTGDGGTTISYTACPGVAGNEDQTGLSADVTGGNSYTANIQFGTCGGNYGGAGEAWIDWDQNQTFDPSESIGTWSGTPPTTLSAFTFTVPLTAINGATRMRVVQQESGSLPLDPCANFTWGSSVDFTINVSGGAPPPSCSSPTGLSASNTTNSSADLSWTPGGTETLWNLEWGVSGFTLGTGTSIIGVTANPYSLTGLNASAQYDFYVQADCGGGDTSSFTGPFTFQTLFNTPTGVSCTTGNAAFVFSDDMDANNGWTGNIGTGNGEWDFPTASPGGNSTQTGPSGPAPGTGTTWAEYEASGNSTTLASLVTPMIDLSTSSGPVELSFYMHAYGSATGLLNVGVGTSATGPFTTEFTWAGQYQTAETDPWAQIGVDLTAYQGQQIYIEFSYRGNGSSYTGDLAIDFVQVETCLSCALPSNLSAANITDTSADLLWTAGGTETSWVVYLDSAGFSPGPSTAINAINDTLNITGLAQSTDYQFYVQALCGTDSSALAGPFSFTTLFTPCSPLSPATLPFIEDFSGTTGSGSFTGDGNIYCGNTYKWTFQTTDQVNGRVTWGSQYPGIPSSGNGALALDAAVNSVVPDPINEAILTVDLSNYSASQNLEFDFEFYDQGDEADVNDRVWIRGSDTDAWVEVYDLTTGSATWTYSGIIDVDAVLAAQSPAQTVSSTFQAKFGQEDNFTWGSDGIGFDNINIRELAANDLAAINGYSSESSGCELSDSAIICIDYVNVGTATQYNPMMEFVIMGGTPVTESTTDTINPGDTVNYCFTSTVDLSVDGTYDFLVTTVLLSDSDSANNSFSFSITNEITPSAPAVFGDTICENSGDTLMLIANGNGSITWYDAASGGNAIASGDTLMVIANSTTSYWAGDQSSISDQVGAVDNTFGGGGSYTFYSDGLVFDVANDVVIDEVVVYPTDTGDVQVDVVDNAGTTIGSVTHFVGTLGANGEASIPLGISVPAGTGYNMISGAGTTTNGLFRNNGGAVYPYSSSNGDVSITGPVNALGGYYYFFYKWTITVSGCPSPLSEAVAFVDPCASINEFGFEGFSIFPNPNNGEFNIANNGETELVDITINDIQGKTVYNQQFNFNSGSQRLIELNGIEKGIYLVKLNSDNGYKVFNIIIQ